MDTSANVIKIDDDSEEPNEGSYGDCIVDLTADSGMNETGETKLPAVGAGTAAQVDDDVEEGEVEEAQEALELCEPSPSKQPLAFEIKFSNECVFKEYGHRILDTLDKALNVSTAGVVQNAVFEFGIENACESDKSTFIKAYMVEQKNMDSMDVMVLSDGEEPEVDKVDHPERAKSAQREDSPILDLGSLFTIDTSGSSKLDTQCVPSYKRSIKDVLNEESWESKRRKLEKEENECHRVRSTQACFNCGVGGHSLRDCPKPRNNARINRAKVARKQERYHIDIEQRFGHLRPGVISEKLQAALGLKRGELPFFFYRMRKLGYPPGWLEEAKVVHSGISLINSDETSILGSENENSQESDEQKYDISKLIDFPGFNVDPGPNFYDDYKHHNVPPFSRHQLKEEFVKDLGSNIIKGYKQKKLKSLPVHANAVENKTSILDTADMEIEDDVAIERNVVFTRPPPPPEPASDVRPPPPPPTSPPPAETTNTPAINERSNSPTLDDLETRKQKLLAELKAGLCDAESSQSTSNDEALMLETNSNEVYADQTTQLPTPKKSIDQSEPATPIANGSIRTPDIIKESHMGTPVLQFSPYEKLPSGENFKVGVSDVINFENLPDSTGKYEQMKTVIKKVRNIITKLHNDDDD
ncbi:zinc finger CCHC domain-containing protein 8 homolog [Anastrepha obliqua]|uniref:zinc finger CCHC domain-containing protein 8 homolog n=1 Tax=Anastrepha obliqua TaxID=95512 RepID=UPI002409D8DC|nr:zinc finger CCHC domain-containing protein 8 homolog [Anastrepha obliqua]